MAGNPDHVVRAAARHPPPRRGPGRRTPACSSGRQVDQRFRGAIRRGGSRLPATVSDAGARGSRRRPLQRVCTGPARFRLHNGTVWRWNRPVYDVQAGHPQLRIENRVLPSGPTAVAPAICNAAFYYGLVRAIVDNDPAPWTQVPFALLTSGTCTVRRGTGRLRGCTGKASSTRSIASPWDVLLPAAVAGLDAWRVDANYSGPVPRCHRSAGSMSHRRCLADRGGAPPRGTRGWAHRRPA